MITNDNFMKLGLGRWKMEKREREKFYMVYSGAMVVRILTREKCEMGYT